MRTRRRTSLIVAALLVAAVVAGCGSDDTTDVATEPDDAATSTTEAPMPDDTTTTSGGAAATGGSQFAVDDLAAHLGIETDQVEVVSVEAVTWRDSSLGCPRKGFMYQQVLTEGTRIVLEADGARYHYHSGGTGDPFRCATPQEPASVG